MVAEIIAGHRRSLGQEMRPGRLLHRSRDRHQSGCRRTRPAALATEIRVAQFPFYGQWPRHDHAGRGRVLCVSWARGPPGDNKNLGLLGSIYFFFQAVGAAVWRELSASFALGPSRWAPGLEDVAGAPSTAPCRRRAEAFLGGRLARARHPLHI